ncbi:hypothetical protein SLS60_011332 [Paraconiothyrium brasiliense]|uniref:CCHC-type domain-containing protein n=1 Tax=Paraconiothyrium brasiliense TaxID=300254 RepID=A0ABR3QJC3_9PLEO
MPDSNDLPHFHGGFPFERDDYSAPAPDFIIASRLYNNRPLPHSYPFDATTSVGLRSREGSRRSTHVKPKSNVGWKSSFDASLFCDDCKCRGHTNRDKPCPKKDKPRCTYCGKRGHERIGCRTEKRDITKAAKTIRGTDLSVSGTTAAEAAAQVKLSTAPVSDNNLSSGSAPSTSPAATTEEASSDTPTSFRSSADGSDGALKHLAVDASPTSVKLSPRLNTDRRLLSNTKFLREKAPQASTDHDPHTQSPQGFMSLPLELREKIWTYAMRDLPSRFIIDEDVYIDQVVFQPDTLLPFTFICRTLKTEIILTWIRRTRFIFSSSAHRLHDKLIRFLEQFEDGLLSVRMIGYHRDSWCRIRTPFEENIFKSIKVSGHLVKADFRSSPAYLVSRCPGITSIVVTAQRLRYLSFPPSTQVERKSIPLTKENLRDYWCFDGLFDMQKLRHFYISCVGEKFI